MKTATSIKWPVKWWDGEQQGRGLGKVIKRGREKKQKASILYSLLPFQLPSKISLFGHPCPHPSACALPPDSRVLPGWARLLSVKRPPRSCPGVLLVGGAGAGAAPSLSRTLCRCDAAPPSPSLSFLYWRGRGKGASDGGRCRWVEGSRGKLGCSTHSSHSLPFSVVNKLEARDKNDT